MKLTIAQIKKDIKPILKKHGIKKAALFGSAARGEMNKKSDIDILVEIKNTMSLLDFVGLKLALEEALGHKVDLVEYSAIKPVIKEEILKSQVPIYYGKK